MRTTRYHPETNDLTKRMNQMVLAMLETLQEKYKTTWKNHVNNVIHACNCTKYSSTGFSPYYLTFGHKSRLSADIILQTEVDPHTVRTGKFRN